MKKFGHDDKPFNASEIFLVSLIDALEEMRHARRDGSYAAWHRILSHLVDTCSFEWESEALERIDASLSKSRNLLNQVDNKQLKLQIPAVDKELCNTVRLFMQEMQKRQRIFYIPKYQTFDEEIKEGFS